MEMKNGSSDGSAFASWSKGLGFESRWILWDALLSERCIVAFTRSINSDKIYKKIYDFHSMLLQALKCFGTD